MATDYFDEYVDYEDTLTTRRANNRAKKKNHKMNGRGLREIGSIFVKRAKEVSN